MMLPLVLLNCAHVGVLAHSLRANGEASSKTNEMPSSAPQCLDVAGQRELLAGIELEAGPQAAALARCNVRAMAADRLAQNEEQKVQDAESRTLWISLGSSLGSAIVGAVVTAVIEAYASPKKSP